ncbi:substrate-binding domain-containing protein [Clostridium cellulovorans]|uniref:Periplasmic binding protein/LacI transcriptional regulator n=1 Tax=Clostridium cellulovorans (strain ATCC 35296 / DSM 3052 / OCM 3 / 743B) TaxID=573061 RepID=D9STC1_CLOC7|nr:substrate-binding domain-containing protein [Clostridium cellulovorans]ADL50737.1 periplasmic binding protein/LacI transcriptional regulator [Clostridium cellulovorans 743B]
MKRLIRIFALFMILILIVMQTNNTKNSIFASENRKVANIAIGMYDFENPQMKSIQQKFIDIQNKNQDKVNFSFYNGKNNLSIQVAIVDSLLLNPTIDFMVIGLSNPPSDVIEDIIRKASLRNMPLIMLDVDPKIASKLSKEYSKVVFLKGKQGEVGIVQGEILVDQWNNNKVMDKNKDNILQYIMLKGATDNPVANDRVKYSVSTINEAGIKTQELALRVVNWSKEIAKGTIESLLLQYAGSIEAIIANDDTIALGAIEALQKYGYNKGNKAKYIDVVGAGGSQEARDLIDKGFMTGTVNINYEAQAEAVYKIAMNLINNVSPIKDTNYTISEGFVVVTGSYSPYTKKNNISS